MINFPIVIRLHTIICASFIALALSLLAPGLLYAAPATQIFVLHSYSQEYPWTQSQHKAFIQAITEDTQVNAAVSTEYLDTKRRAYDETYAADLARHLRIKYNGYQPAAIYVTDDNALLFARDHLSRIFPGTPVFFSAVNDYDVRKSLDPAIFTGVFELKEVAPNLEWLLRMDKDANDLVFIGDGSNTYQAIEREARKDLLPYRLRATFIAEKRLDRAVALLRALPGKYLFLTTLGGMTDANGQVLSLREIMKSLPLTGRIVISMEDAYILEGVLGGYVTSGQHQGMSAARLLLAHLHGKPIVDLPPILKSPNALIFDDRVLHQYGINLPESLRAQAVLLNPHPGIYERYRSLILGSLIGLAALLFLVVTGSLVIMSRKNRELGLARNSAESANALFNQLADQSRTVHWKVNPEGLYTYVSPVSYAVLGYRPEELIGKKHFYDLFTEDERDANKIAALEFFAQKEPFHDLENAAMTKDGRLIWLLTNGFPVLDDQGAFLGYRGSDSDITERKRAEEAIIKSEARLIQAQAIAHFGNWEIDLTNGLLWGSEEAFRIYGIEYPGVASAFLPLADIQKAVHPEDRPRMDNSLRALLQENMRYDQEFRIVRINDGALKVIHSQADVFASQQGTPLKVFGTIQDITSRKQAEDENQNLLERLNRAEKMEALGQLAGGVAHDLNNVLGILTGYSELLLEEIPEESQSRTYVDKILQSTKKGAAIIEDLLTLARRGVTTADVINLNSVVSDYLQTPVFEKVKDFHPLLTFHTECDKDLLNIKGSPVHLEKTVMNLVSNAAEAISDAGEITIRTESRHLDKPVLGYDEVKEGDYAVLIVSDTGMGIPPESRGKIFEPFYTKKKMGRSGTGLGLAIVWGTVKDHNGYIDIQSEVGKGTTFTLYFPVTRNEMTAQQEKEPADQYMGHGESVLVVDDVAEQREIAAELLTRLGYEVHLVSGGEDAVEYLKENKADILILDMIMDPGIDGLETYQRILEINPKQKAIIVSGFSETDRVGEAQKLGAAAYIKKPYMKEKIGVAIRNELNRK